MDLVSEKKRKGEKEGKGKWVGKAKFFIFDWVEKMNRHFSEKPFFGWLPTKKCIGTSNFTCLFIFLSVNKFKIQILLNSLKNLEHQLYATAKQNDICMSMKFCMYLNFFVKFEFPTKDWPWHHWTWLFYMMLLILLASLFYFL